MTQESVLALLGIGSFVVSWVCLWLAKRAEDHAERLLREHRQTNLEFGEAIELMMYGAHDEAVEVCRRWMERA